MSTSCIAAIELVRFVFLPSGLSLLLPLLRLLLLLAALCPSTSPFLPQYIAYPGRGLAEQTPAPTRHTTEGNLPASTLPSLERTTVHIMCGKNTNIINSDTLACGSQLLGLRVTHSQQFV